MEVGRLRQFPLDAKRLICYNYMKESRGALSGSGVPTGCIPLRVCIVRPRTVEVHFAEAAFCRRHIDRTRSLLDSCNTQDTDFPRICPPQGFEWAGRTPRSTDGVWDEEG